MKIIWKTMILTTLTVFLLYIWTSNYVIFNQNVKAENNLSSSTIGGLEVESLNKEEVISLLNTQINEWKEKPILLIGNSIELSLLPEWFSFDVEASVNEYFNQVDTPWYVFWKSPPTVHIPLQFSIDSELTSLIEKQGHLNVEETMANIKNQVGILSTKPIETAALDSSVFQSERIAFDIEKISINSSGLNDIISKLNDQVIESGEVFSLLEHLEEVNFGNNNESADFVASILYSVLLQTNFEIVERYSQGVIPPYLEPGVEAKISKSSNEDLKFINQNNTQATLKLTLKDSSLLIEIYSIPSETTASYQVRDRLEVKPRTIYRYSSDLNPGQEELVQEGVAGLRVSLNRTISEKSGPFEKEDLISQDFYPPVNRIVLTSSVIPESTSITDSDLDIDMNGDGLSDINTSPSSNSNNANISEESPNENVSEELPEGSYYDKAGNIIHPESK
ncbi:VanW family protein [Psychrobacillus sp. FJAT-51614]|uniref:VanW family protein n=1 Tax=Psychrobacillus mangrovi TaxID=3117745 RepID=A0ABU8F325_9BACI